MNGSEFLVLSEYRIESEQNKKNVGHKYNDKNLNHEVMTNGL